MYTWARKKEKKNGGHFKACSGSVMANGRGDARKEEDKEGEGGWRGWAGGRDGLREKWAR